MNPDITKLYASIMHKLLFTIASISGVLSASTPTYLSYQDSIGQYSFGYSAPLSARSEVRSADGLTRGTYSYVDDNGYIQSADYVADENGFRIIATNLPQAPLPVEYTPEVLAAREAHFQAHREAILREEEAARTENRIEYQYDSRHANGDYEASEYIKEPEVKLAEGSKHYLPASRHNSVPIPSAPVTQHKIAPTIISHFRTIGAVRQSPEKTVASTKGVVGVGHFVKKSDDLQALQVHFHLAKTRVIESERKGNENLESRVATGTAQKEPTGRKLTHTRAQQGGTQSTGSGITPAGTTLKAMGQKFPLEIHTQQGRPAVYPTSIKKRISASLNVHLPEYPYYMQYTPLQNFEKS